MNEQRRLVAAGSETVPFTAADYLQMVEAGAFDNMRVELVRGELHKMQGAYLSHGKSNLRVGALLLNATADAPLDVAIDLLIQLDEDTILAADVAMVGNDTPLDAPARPDDVVLVAEIATTTLRRDLGTKRQCYAGSAIAHYWVVDTEQCIVHVFADPHDGDYRQAHQATFTDPIPVPGTDRSITLG